MVLQELFRSVTNAALRRRSWQDMCRDLLRLKDEATVLKLAQEIHTRYIEFDREAKVEFFQFLLDEFRADQSKLQNAIAQYQADPSPDNVQLLNRASLPARRQIFQLLNMTPNGTLNLVSMRSDLLSLLDAYTDLQAVDKDLEILLGAWFNRGFLSLEQIDWETPAFILEKLIRYEAVHEITGWDDLRRRVSSGRRCYAFFHPALPDEPIIFVQVALANGLAGSIDQLIRDETVAPIALEDEARANTAIFYSISNCQPGLRGIAFGDLLIKQVVDLISSELPHIKTYSTLSPIPGFGTWMKRAARDDDSDLSAVERAVITQLQNSNDREWVGTQCADSQPILMALCAHYLLNEKRGNAPLDPVSRFHLRNGARLERINWLGDTSAKGIQESAGLLANYVYDRKSVTKNHEKYIYDNEVVSSNAVAQLAKRRG
jgi:malonyl-CoA decarboxylase